MSRQAAPSRRPISLFYGSASLAAQAHAHAVAAARQSLEDTINRQNNIAFELEETPKDNQAWRTRLCERFGELEDDRLQTLAHLTELEATQPTIDPGDPALLDHMPHVQQRLADLPEHLLRTLFDVLNLEVTAPNARQAIIKITLTADTAPALASAGLTGTNQN